LFILNGILDFSKISAHKLLLEDIFFNLRTVVEELRILLSSQTQARNFTLHNESDPRLPIIAMTANIRAEDRQKCLEAGMDDYLAKPVNKELLQNLLRQQLAGVSS
jgi:CheY-like chemotaxis protein